MLYLRLNPGSTSRRSSYCEAPTVAIKFACSAAQVAVIFLVAGVRVGWLVDLTGNWNVAFATGIGILLTGAAAVLLLWPDLPLMVPIAVHAESADMRRLVG